MICTMSELRNKEVVNSKTGLKLGYVDDLEFDISGNTFFITSEPGIILDSKGPALEELIKAVFDAKFDINVDIIWQKRNETDDKSIREIFV